MAFRGPEGFSILDKKYQCWLQFGQNIRSQSLSSTGLMVIYNCLFLYFKNILRKNIFFIFLILNHFNFSFFKLF
jgi:hypothetical protein